MRNELEGLIEWYKGKVLVALAEDDKAAVRASNERIEALSKILET